MKFFIVDNGSLYLKHIVNRVSANHDYIVQTYSPFEPLDAQDADFIILSGGMQNEVADDLDNGDPWYRHEFDLIQRTDKPILGICLGLQMIAVALGGSLSRLPSMVDTNKHVVLTNEGEAYFSQQELYVHERHQWVVDSADIVGMNILAHSNDGIEILHYPERNIIGTQFHPEIDASPNSPKLFWDILQVIEQPAEVARA